MSAQFSKGDKVRKTTVEHTVMGSGFVDHGEQFAKKGAVGTITDVEGPAIMWVEWDEGTPSRINVEHLEQVEPEFVVGQQVSGDDYERLPVGAVVVGHGDHLTKTGRDQWKLMDSDSVYPDDDWLLDRTLTHLPATEPEDKADLYVEPEPLKEGDRAFNDDDVQRLKVTHGSEVLFDGLAVFEEADDGKVTVTPVPRCTSLFIRPGSDSSLGIVRCGQHQGHGHGHWTIGEHPATSWNDNQEYGRMEGSS